MSNWNTWFATLFLKNNFLELDSWLSNFEFSQET